VGVAYYVLGYADGRDDDHLLRYAAQSGTGWTVRTVDAQTRCGEHCTLAFDRDGVPAVAYRELETHAGYPLRNLKYARLNGSVWSTEVVSTAGDIGLYNTLRFAPDGKATLFSYSATEARIYLFQK
jgi:hypothetical protein